MKQIQVVMLGHKSQSGKDTIYDIIGKEMGFKRLAFADKLKYTVADLYDFSEEQMFGDEKDILDLRYSNNRDLEFIADVVGELDPNPDYLPYFTPRRVLQLFGQDQRSINPTIWADYIFNVRIPYMIEEEGISRFLITDFRFKNEAIVAKKWESSSDFNTLQMVKVNRPNIKSKTAAGDISENDLNDFKYWTDTILNDGSLEDLEDRAKEVLTQHLPTNCTIF